MVEGYLGERQGETVYSTFMYRLLREPDHEQAFIANIPVDLGEGNDRPITVGGRFFFDDLAHGKGEGALWLRVEKHEFL